ncbi:hypothetical protein ABZ897_47970 [Nonomuraea sp. NPDC046802]|uniref:hypothetical protein n=1 Tax=Nonomuraea sp. NPDC046802 TaxID=3154919 RepID=UPI0033FC4207
MDALRRALGALSCLYALIFFSFALSHAGIGLLPLGEPVIVPAAIVETLCGGAVLAGAYGALTGREWAWDGLIYTHAGALAGVLLGIVAVALGAANEVTGLLMWYHGIMATALAAGLAGSFYVSRVRR